MELTTGTTLHGFRIETADALEEISGTAYVMRHEKSGARLLYLANEDENKAFSIGFKTPPADSTGVFHILEHSVLCGSKRFPVKEPFVNLIKSSMQTFLNAMTFPDKTIYPVASTNEQDLLNLMDVYMDAVFNPAIYERRTIFEQEGWHYEIDGADEPLRYNGVVYNEMKGALSDPDSILYNSLSSALFPDTAYAFESGGDPASIPELTYESFLDSHARHYRFDNSYIVLYGDMHIERELAFLDERYLSSTQSSAKEPNPLIMQEPVKQLGIVKKMQTAPENACIGTGYVVGTATDRIRVIATDILIDVLMGSNEAPLKKALLKAGIGGDAQGYLVDAQLQPIVILQSKGCEGECIETFLETIDTTVSKLAQEGIDRERIEASLSRAEFMLRERDFGIADGVLLAMNAMAGWLYDDTMATDYLRFESVFTELRTRMDEGYFEQLAREIFLENNHMAQASVEPVEELGEDGETERLTAIKATLDQTAIERIQEEVAHLRELQEAPDSPEALATLPLLTLDDIAEAPVETSWELEDNTPLPCIYHNIPTRGIDYIYTYYSLESIPFEDLPYVTVLAMLLGKLDTAQHTAEELDKLTQTNLGSLRFFSDLYTNDADTSIVTPRFVIATSSLSEDISYAIDLPTEIRDTTRFTDKDAIRDVLTQRRIGMEQYFASSGNSAALSRCASYVSATACGREQMGGVDFYRFLKDTLTNFDNTIDTVITKLEEVSRVIFTADNVLVSFTGPREDHDRFWGIANTMGLIPSQLPKRFSLPEPQVKNEAFIVPADVCFAAKGFDARLEGIPYDGSWQVAGKALSYDYLWNEVRVKGGAYGAGFRAMRTGSMQFYSYRDPNLDETLARFDSAAAWLAAFKPEETEMRGYIISSVAGLDAPSKPREIARRQDGDWFSKRPSDYRKVLREQLLATTSEKLRAHGNELAQVVAHDVRCAFGSRSIIEDSQATYEIVDLLN